MLFLCAFTVQAKLTYLAAHIDFDLHQAVDGCQEKELGDASIGTTKKGIGPCFASKATRSGVMLAEIFDHATLEEKLRKLESGYRKRYGDLLAYDVEEEIARFKTYAEQLADFAVDEITLMRSAKQRGSFVVIEGAQATMLDISYGTYPYVTSSNCSVGGILAGK
jgi:adenylosuccinate synthase